MFLSLISAAMPVESCCTQQASCQCIDLSDCQSAWLGTANCVPKTALKTVPDTALCCACFVQLLQAKAFFTHSVNLLWLIAVLHNQ